MTNDVDFDALVQKTMTGDAAAPDLTPMNELYGHLFALPNWHFVARGTLPDIKPYMASHPEVADGKPMVMAFTDPDRLQRFVKSNSLEEADGSSLAINIPTESIIPYLEGFIPNGVFGIWFNPDPTSNGFFVPLAQLRLIKDHLDKIGWQQS